MPLSRKWEDLYSLKKSPPYELGRPFSRFSPWCISPFLRQRGALSSDEEIEAHCSISLSSPVVCIPFHISSSFLFPFFFEINPCFLSLRCKLSVCSCRIPSCNLPPPDLPPSLWSTCYTITCSFIGPSKFSHPPPSLFLFQILLRMKPFPIALLSSS